MGELSDDTPADSIVDRDDLNRVAAQRRKAADLQYLLVGGLAGLLAGLVGLLLLPWRFITAPLLALLVAGVLTWWVWRNANPMVLRGLSARSFNPADHPRLANVVNGIRVIAGVNDPEIRIVDDPAPNALVAGREAREPTLVVTSGLLDRLDRVELEAVIAHCFGRISSEEIVPATAAVPTVGYLLRPLRAGVLDRVLDADREWQADRAAVSLTRFPPGLVRALDKMTDGGTVRSPDAIAHLWMIAPGTAGAEVSARADVLREL